MDLFADVDEAYGVFDFDVPSIPLADLDWGLNFIHAYGEISEVSIKNQSLFNQVVLRK